jgi:hypothetical protein
VLVGIDVTKIVETWKIYRVGGLSRKSNLVALFNDGTHICTCLETITKGIICRHFWHVMLYSSAATFHISIIPVRWYKDEILMKFDNVLENSPVLTAISTNNATPYEVNFTLESLRHIQGSDHKESIQQVIPQRNRFGVAFSTAKTAINIALETKSDNELVQMLKSFILSKKNRNEVSLEENIDAESNNNENNSEILPLQQYLIAKTTDPYVTKIRGAPCKKRIKGGMEMSKGKRVGETNNNIQVDDREANSKAQRKCLLCGIPGHYQKRCPNAKNGTE